MLALALALWVGAAPLALGAQQMGGLDLTGTAPVAPPAGAEAGSLDLTQGGDTADGGVGLDLTTDFTTGPPFLVMPPRGEGGEVDRAAHRLLLEALAPHFGTRPLSTQATFEALEREGLQGPSVQRPEAAVGLAEVLAAPHAVGLEPAGHALLRVHVYRPPEPAPVTTLELTDAWPLTAERTQRVAATLAAGAGQALNAPAAPPPPVPAVVAEPPVPIVDKDLEEERRLLERRRKRRQPRRPVSPARASRGPPRRAR